MTANYQTYKTICEENYVPLAAQYWWLDVVCGQGNWEVAIAKNDKGKIVGALPYSIHRFKGLKVIKMPLLTAKLHIWLAYPPSEKPHKKYSFERKTLEALIDQIPNLPFFDQNYSAELTNTLPFHWKGFRQTTRYTYLLEDLSNLSDIHRNMEGSVRTYIRKAEDIVKIEKLADLETFYEVAAMSFQKQGKKMPYSLAFLRKVDEGLNNRNLRQIYFAKDPSGNIHAAGYVVWDKQRAYYLLSGTNPEFRQSGAHYLLLWTAIKDCAKFVKSFDFEGSMLPQIEPIFRAFGGIQQPYSRIFKAKNKFFEFLNFLKGY